MDKHYEYLTKLYLRLKGYVVTNLIIHSSVPGNMSSEIDIVGIRMPYHMQEDRKVNFQDDLESAMDRIEIIIADVKNINNPNSLKFNKGLRRDNESIKKLIAWLGCFDKIDESLIQKFSDNLNLHRNKNLNDFSQFQEDLNIGLYNFKFTFFCPSLPLWNGQGFKYINGTQMIDFIWECLNEINIIETCSRRYNFECWNEFQDYIRFFKDAKTKIDLNDFEKVFS